MPRGGNKNRRKISINKAGVPEGGIILASEVIEVTDANFQAEVLDSDIPVIVDFWAAWCGPCRMVGPIVEEIARDQEGKVKVAKLNVDDNREVATKYGIMSIPTILKFENGAVSRQVVGAMPKSALVQELGLA
ncbi:MAG: thioredoxin [Gaiellales bacterium]|nr:MAG: thioredoxin [Gaiellales bacterium]